MIFSEDDLEAGDFRADVFIAEDLTDDAFAMSVFTAMVFLVIEW